MNPVLDMAKAFAAEVATPMLVTDGEGNLLYFNEPAERVLGGSFADSGELPASTWEDAFRPERSDGTPLLLKDMPAGVALIEGRPACDTMRITGLDGVERMLEVTAFPLFEQVDRLVGIIAVFWESDTFEDEVPQT